MSAVEGLAALCEHADAGCLYPQMLDVIDRAGLLLPWSAVPLERIAGIAAASAGKLVEAEAHLRALEQAHSLPFRKEQPEVRYWYARMLLDRDAHGDRAKACRMLKEAAADYGILGMPRHGEMAREILQDAI